MQKNKKTLSVIVPSYKAGKFIKEGLLDIKEVVDNLDYNYEIICVVDGEVDNTFIKAKSVAKRFPGHVKVIGYKQNHGKGHAVRFGMAQAKGDIIAFVDAGSELNPKSLTMLLEHFNWYNADIIVGSKRHPASKVIYPWQRKIMSFIYQIMVRVLFGLKVKDTQVGMKVFKRKVLEDTLPRLLVKAFAFDIEMLSVANYLGYSRIYEAPVDLTMKFSGGPSTIVSKKFLNVIFFMIWDTVAVFYRLRITHYYDAKNKKNWITPNYLRIH